MNLNSVSRPNYSRPVLLRLILASAAIAVAPSLARAGETVLYCFQGGSDGAWSDADLIFDSQGALYGATANGGASGNGTVFKLTPPAKGQTQWKEIVLYSFKGPLQNDGANPSAGLIFDKQGALYGTTANGGLRAMAPCSNSPLRPRGRRNGPRRYFIASKVGAMAVMPMPA